MGAQNNVIRSFFGTHFLYLPETHMEPSFIMKFIIDQLKVIISTQQYNHTTSPEIFRRAIMNLQ